MRFEAAFILPASRFCGLNLIFLFLWIGRVDSRRAIFRQVCIFAFMSFTLLYVTHPDEKTAREISERLLDERLIACANTFSIASGYWWNGAVQREGEWVTLLKTTASAWPSVEKRVLELHPYDTPCVMKMEVSANAAYEAWIEESVHVS
jgi:periplasmic divalent cation tolerance protein